MALLVVALFSVQTESLRESYHRRLAAEHAELTQALAEVEVETLHGLLPICANCKKIRDDQGYWSQVETYIGDRTDVRISHSLCPECAQTLYGLSVDEDEKNESP